jgi:hypothetical protein
MKSTAILPALLGALSCAVLSAWAQQAPAHAGPAGMPLQGPPPPVRASSQVDYAAELTVIDGRYRPERSLAAAALAGKAGDGAAAGFALRSAAADRNGIIVHGGATAYTVSNASIALSGNASNDFEGIGAGVLVDRGGSVVLKSVRITTDGVLAAATTAREKSVLKVYDSVLTVHGGALPANYVPKIGPGMMEPPAPLGIKGTARAHLSTSNSKTYFYRSTIVADGWGALSTDDTGGNVYLEANDCDIQVKNSGYGVYADFGATVVLKRSRLKTATFGGIIAGAGKIEFQEVQGESGGNAVMIHSVMGNPLEKGILALSGGRLASAHATVLVKSANADITIDHVDMLPADGTLVRSVVNTDPNATRVDGKAPPGIHVTLKNADLKGNILHQDSARGMVLELDRTRLRGAIRNATLALGKDSRWTATGDSNVVLSGAVDLAQLDAAAGVTISAQAGPGSALLGSHALAGGGRVIITGR